MEVFEGIAKRGRSLPAREDILQPSKSRDLSGVLEGA